MIYDQKGCDNLVHAIVMQAVKDYKLALHKPFKQESISRMKNIEHFITRDWFKTITLLDPQTLLKKLHEDKQAAERRFIEHEQMQILRSTNQMGKDNKRQDNAL